MRKRLVYHTPKRHDYPDDGCYWHQPEKPDGTLPENEPVSPSDRWIEIEQLGMNERLRRRPR